MRYAVVVDNIIVNIIEANDGFAIKGLDLVADTAGVAGVGGRYKDGVFTPPVYVEPEPVVPDRVTARQFKMQLEIDGLLDSVDAWIGQQEKLVQIAYQNSGTFVRSEPMMQSGFQALKYDDARIDAFFMAANSL